MTPKLRTLKACSVVTTALMLVMSTGCGSADDNSQSRDSVAVTTTSDTPGSGPSNQSPYEGATTSADSGAPGSKPPNQASTSTVSSDDAAGELAHIDQLDNSGTRLDEADAFVPNATVKQVTDGDTIVAKIGSHTEPVRLIGIDTPESVARYRPVECYGAEASTYLEHLLPPGTRITLVGDVESRDMYDRLLGYVFRSDDNLFINLELVSSGYAATLNFPPNDHYADVFAQAESRAVADRLGLWGACGGPDVPLE